MKRPAKNFQWKHFANYIVISVLLIYFAVSSMTGNLRSSSQYLLEKIGYSMILAVSLSMLVENVTLPHSDVEAFRVVTIS